VGNRKAEEAIRASRKLDDFEVVVTGLNAESLAVIGVYFKLLGVARQ
jgi:hypothetical protein